MAHPNVQNDPLLFLESMGAPETRDYVKRVMAYYWMYSRRMREPAPSLDQSARGDWPLYKPSSNMLRAPQPVATPPVQQPMNGSNVVSDADTPH
jgi:hypothetical protein